jgi:hypothetical protein
MERWRDSVGIFRRMSQVTESGISGKWLSSEIHPWEVNNNQNYVMEDGEIESSYLDDSFVTFPSDDGESKLSLHGSNLVAVFLVHSSGLALACIIFCMEMSLLLC